MYHLAKPLDRIIIMQKDKRSIFIARCLEHWGDSVDLSETQYLDSRTPIIVKCIRHGAFETDPRNFQRGYSGCKKCTFDKDGKAAKLLASFASKHGDRYGYELFEYTNYKTPAKIICKTHGVFEQLPYVHARGSGCPACGEVKRVSTEDFIQRAMGVYGDLYDYSLTVYTTATTKVKIICSKHGMFEQLPHNHLTGRGCKLCANGVVSKKKQMSLAQAMDECEKRGLSLVAYSGCANSKSIIECKQGHRWSAPLSRITRGNSCPTCAKSGYNPSKDGFVYVLVSECQRFMKIGLSNSPTKRIKTLATTTPFKFRLVCKKRFDGADAPKNETLMHQRCTSAGLTCFDGATEWFLYDQLHIDFLNSLSQQ